MVVEVKECVCDELSKVGLTEVLACWTVMVKTTVVKKTQRSCKGLLLLKVRMKVELVARCDGQGEKVMRVREHEGLVYLCNYVVNVVLLKIPATKNKHILKMMLLQYHNLGEKTFEECV